MPTNSNALVRFASSKVEALRRHATLPVKFTKLLQGYPLREMFGGKSVAIKMHVGNDIGYTTIHPLFVRNVVDAVKEAEGKPFITDGSGSMHNAVTRGYTEEVLGAPLLPAAGIANNYAYTRDINYRTLDVVDLCGNIVDADAMIVLSHGKGHGHCGFGGVIKNLAMGCVARDTRAKIHRLQGDGFDWDADKCTRCGSCVESCPAIEALEFDDEDNLKWMDHHCRYCRHCEMACPEDAIKLSTGAIEYFQRGMALTAKAVVDTFDPNRLLYITVLLSITPYCDCWGFSTPSIVPDIGIVAGTDLVAVEQASLDLIRVEDFIPTSLPPDMTLAEGKHLFEKIHGKDPYLQVQCAAELGLGSRAYEFEEIE